MWERRRGPPSGSTDRTFQFSRGLTEDGETNAACAVWALWPDLLPSTIWLWVAALAETGVQRIRTAGRVL